MSPRMVKAGLSSLRLTRLHSEKLCRVYYVHKGEKLGYKVRRVPKGTPVYSLPDGTPVLIQVCGNPLRGMLPSFTRERISSHVPVFSPDEPAITFHRESAAYNMPIDGKGAAHPLGGRAEDWVQDPEVASPESIPADPKLYSLIDPVLVARGRLASFASSVVPPTNGDPGIPGHGGSPPPPDTGIDGFPPVIWFPPGGSGGGGGGTTPPGGGTNPPDGGDQGIDSLPPPLVTPEGSSLALLGMGSVPVLLLLRPKSKKRAGR